MQAARPGDPVGADYSVTGVDLVSSAWYGEGQGQHPAAREWSAMALSVLVPLRIVYIAMLQAFGWLALLGRPGGAGPRPHAAAPRSPHPSRCRCGRAAPASRTSGPSAGRGDGR